MYAAHESYRGNCRLSVGEVDFLVEAVRRRGAACGLYGAKITGGGTGGAVAVFGKLGALAEHVPQFAEEYSRRVGAVPEVFEGTSPGAFEFGHRRYGFGASGWQRVEGVMAKGATSGGAGGGVRDAAFSGITCGAEGIVFRWWGRMGLRGADSLSFAGVGEGGDGGDLYYRAAGGGSGDSGLSGGASNT